MQKYFQNNFGIKLNLGVIFFLHNIHIHEVFILNITFCVCMCMCVYMCVLYFYFIYADLCKHRPLESYQSIKHKRIKGFTVRVLHHNVEKGVQSVLKKLNTHTHTDYKMKQKQKHTHHSVMVSLKG